MLWGQHARGLSPSPEDPPFSIEGRGPAFVMEASASQDHEETQCQCPGAEF